MNIKQKVELLEEKLRRNFYYWLDICSRKIEKELEFDGDIIIVIEGINQFNELDTGMPADLKFWLPKTFPRRIKFIVTAGINTSAHDYLKNIKCERLLLTVDKSLYTEMIKDLNENQAVCSSDNQKKCHDIIQKKMGEESIPNILFLKIFYSAFCPYESPELVTGEQISKSKIDKILKDLDWEKIESLETVSDLINYILEYFETRITDKEKFRK